MHSITNIIDGSCNTRLKPIAKIAVHLDYLRFTAQSLTTQGFENLMEFVSSGFDTIPGQPWSPGGGAVWYPNKLIGIHGFVGGFEVNDEGLISCMIQVSGEYFEQLNLIDQWRLIIGLKHSFDVKCTRIDIAIDDPTYSIIPIKEMLEACDRKQNFGFRKQGHSSSGMCGEEKAETEYFGSRDSGRYSRIYDHEGKCRRHECEFKRDIAQPIFDAIADIQRPVLDENNPLESYVEYKGEEPASAFERLLHESFSGYVLGAIDFRDRGNRKESGRAGYRDSTRLSFYQEYIDNIRGGFIRVKGDKPAKSLHKTINWLKRQISATLAMFSRGLGRASFNLWVRELVMHGEEKLSQLQELWIAEMKSNPRAARI